MCMCVYIYTCKLICLFLAALGLCCCVGFSLVVVSGSYSLVVCGFSLHSMGARVSWLQQLQFLGSRVQAQ